MSEHLPNRHVVATGGAGFLGRYVIAGLTGFTGRICWDSSQPDGQPRRCLDVSRAKALFGFETQTSFDEGLRQTVDWYRASRAPARA